MQNDIDKAVGAIVQSATADEVVMYRKMAEADGFEIPADWIQDIASREIERRCKKVARALMDGQVEDVPGQQVFPGLDLPQIVVADDEDGTTMALPLHQATGPQLESHVNANERRQRVKYMKAKSQAESAAKLRAAVGEPFEDMTVGEMDDALHNPVTEIP